MPIGIFLGVMIRHASLFFIPYLPQRHTNKKGRTEQKKHLKCTEESGIGSGFINMGGGGYKCIYKRFKFLRFLLNLNFRKNHFRFFSAKMRLRLHSVPINYYWRAHTLLILSLLVQSCETSVVR